jgi:hypothetical protein
MRAREFDRYWQGGEAMSLKRNGLGLLAAFCLMLPSCQGDKDFCILGYTTKPNYDCSIHTVRIPIFKNNLMGDSVTRGIEFQLTQAVVREIELKTPYKVVGPNEPADTELTGIITTYAKVLLNRNQLNEVREAENDLVVALEWRDLRTGELLSKPHCTTPPPPLPPGVPPPKDPPTLVFAKGDFIPELGQSTTTSRQQAVNTLAVNIVSMMESPW